MSTMTTETKPTYDTEDTPLPLERCTYSEIRRFGHWVCIMDAHEGGHYLVNEGAR